jgi:signal transduction histidine kinase
MKLFTKGLLIVAIPSLFELLLLGALIKTQAESADAERWAMHSKTVIIQASEVREPMLLESARIRNSIIVNEPAAISQPAMWDDMNAKLQNLQMLVKDNPEQLVNIKAIQGTVARYRAWADEAKRMLTNGQREQLVMQLKDTEGPHRLNDFRSNLAKFMETEQRLAVERAEDVEDAKDWLNSVLIASVLGSILAAGIAVYIFSRNIGGRLTVLSANAQRLAEGEPLAARVGGSDEISLLDDVLHRSSERIMDANLAAASYREELESRARELAELNNHLRQQTQDNEMFIYSVSHDLRSPLVNLQGFSKEITHATRELTAEIERTDLPPADKKKVSELVNEDIGTSLKFIQSAVTRAAGIIDAMLRLSRVGRVEYQQQRNDLTPILQRVVDAMSGTIREKGVTINIGALPEVHGDPTAIEQIFGNLVGNAVNYLDPKRPGQIEVGYETDRPDVGDGLNVYYVKDNGLGIPATHMPKMFSAFQRLHGSVAQGEGVGLALVKRMVERHGGKIWVESTEGVGTTFFVALPAREGVALA